uniref:Uncharacterized protein n=1 Tax=Rhizophora mucronata TaxID=61149 RepID=A0A2P2QH63_RHIMU
MPDFIKLTLVFLNHQLTNFLSILERWSDMFLVLLFSHTSLSLLF